MNAQAHVGINSVGYRLVRVLLDAFPSRINLNYFELCRADPHQTGLSDESRLTFNALSAFVETLIGENIVRGDHFADGRYTFFWNVGLTMEGYRLAKQVVSGMTGDQIDDCGLLLDLCSRDVSVRAL